MRPGFAFGQGRAMCGKLGMFAIDNPSCSCSSSSTNVQMKPSTATSARVSIVELQERVPQRGAAAEARSHMERHTTWVGLDTARATRPSHGGGSRLTPYRPWQMGCALGLCSDAQENLRAASAPIISRQRLACRAANRVYGCSSSSSV
jgi:hypothetical protein